MTCAECDAPVRTRGLCNAHYKKALRSGEVARFPRYSGGAASAPRRFWSRVAVTPGCWEWLGRCNAQGYGTLRVERHEYAHRYAYAAVVGPIPDGLTLDHLCRNTRCVNPAHLEPVTLSENSRRGALARRSA